MLKIGKKNLGIGWDNCTPLPPSLATTRHGPVRLREKVQTNNPDKNQDKSHRIRQSFRETMTSHVQPRVSASSPQTGHKHQHQERDVTTCVHEELEKRTPQPLAKLKQ